MVDPAASNLARSERAVRFRLRRVRARLGDPLQAWDGSFVIVRTFRISFNDDPIHQRGVVSKAIGTGLIP